MSVIILVIHLMIAIALVGSVLLQRSEGGALASAVAAAAVVDLCRVVVLPMR